VTTARVCAITVVAIAPAVVIALVVSTVGALVRGELAEGGDLLLALFGTTLMLGAISAAAGTAIGVSAALFAVEIASPSARQAIKALVGGLHAIPAVGFGLTAAGAILFAAQPPNALEVFFLAAVVLAIMLASVVFVQMRRELNRVPASMREAACAAGADSVQIVLRAVLPAIRRKIVGIWWATFGLALGEATALSMIFAAANLRNVDLGTLASTLLRVGSADRGVAIVALAPTALVLLAMSIATIVIGRRTTGEVAWP